MVIVFTQRCHDCKPPCFATTCSVRNSLTADWFSMEVDEVINVVKTAHEFLECTTGWDTYRR
jgi:hypothetical protein